GGLIFPYQELERVLFSFEAADDGFKVFHQAGSFIWDYTIIRPRLIYKIERGLTTPASARTMDGDAMVYSITTSESP
ncbi:MAG: hypothetical protein LLF87_10655, partial [Eubacteriales bacterium]|nr:hypothetical protein [Eubacteriales bacterium]